MRHTACAAWPSAAVQLPALAHSRIGTGGRPTQRLSGTAFSPPRCWAWPEQYPGRTRLLISCADGYTQLMARCAAELRGTYRFACPPPAALALADKQQFAAVCRAVGLRTPQSITVYPGDIVLELPFGWPVVVKPADSPAWWNCRFPGKRKVYLARDAAELQEILSAAARSSYCGAMLLQEYIPGPDTRLGVVNAYCAADGSVPWFVQGQPLLQERTPEGIGNYAAVLVEPARQDTALLEALRGLLQTAGWRGFANFDLKYDRRGEPVLFELNPRQGRAAYYCDAAGAPLARPLVEDLLFGGPVTPPALAPGGVVHGPLGRGAPPLPQQAAPAPCRPPAPPRARVSPFIGPGGGDGKADLVCGKAGGIRRKLRKNGG